MSGEKTHIAGTQNHWTNTLRWKDLLNGLEKVISELAEYKVRNASELVAHLHQTLLHQ